MKWSLLFSLASVFLLTACQTTSSRNAPSASGSSPKSDTNATHLQSSVQSSFSVDTDVTKQLLNNGQFREARNQFYQRNHDILNQLESAEANLLDQAWKEWEAKKPDKGLSLAYDLIALIPISIPGHKTLEVFHEKIATALSLDDDPSAKNYHELKESHAFIVQGLVRSIAISGNGKTRDNPYEVISRVEADAFLDVMGMQSIESSAFQEDGRTLLQVTSRNQGNRSYTIYFGLPIQ